MSTQVSDSSYVFEEPDSAWDSAIVWFAWSIATIAAWSIGWAFGIPFGEAVQKAYVSPVPGAVGGLLAQNIARVLFGAIFGIAVGTLSGVVQWVVLRQHISRAWLWIPFTIVGMTIGMAFGWPLRWIILWELYSYTAGGPIYEVVHGNTGMLIGWAIAASVGGITTGVLQWLLLRRFRRSFWWIIASIVGMALAVAVGWAIERTMLGDVGSAISGASAGVFYSAITGFALVPILRRPRRMIQKK